MEKLFLLFLFFHVSSPVKHSLKYFATRSSGISNFPEFMITAEVDNTVAIYCDTIKKKVEPKQDWMKKFFESDPEHLQWCEFLCVMLQPNLFKAMIDSIMQVFNQTGGVHILQGIVRIEWDDETGEVDSFMYHSYDGEDILSLDLKTQTWMALKPEAQTIKQRWDADRTKINEDVTHLTQILPELLKKYVAFTNGSLTITDLPSVSLLQQTPSSPVRCFASGFYPERASLFWRKDGVELHEDVEHGEILPNTDGTFQMSVDLKVSSPEDWRRYECVFQLSGVKDDIVTKLNKTAIRTNWAKTEIRAEKPSAPVTLMVVLITLLVLALITGTGFVVYKLKKAKDPQLSPESNSEQLQRLQESTDQNDKHAK